MIRSDWMGRVVGGAAFPHQDGVVLQALPIDGKIVLR